MDLPEIITVEITHDMCKAHEYSSGKTCPLAMLLGEMFPKLKITVGGYGTTDIEKSVYWTGETEYDSNFEGDQSGKQGHWNSDLYQKLRKNPDALPHKVVLTVHPTRKATH